MEPSPADAPFAAPINYASPGTYHVPRRFTGIVIASYIIATIGATIWVSVLFSGVDSLKDALRGIADPEGCLVVIALGSVMTTLAIILLVAANQLRKLQPLGFWLHRVFAILQIMVNVVLYIILVPSFGEPWTEAVLLALIPVAVLSIYPILVLALLHNQPKTVREPDPPTSSAAV